MQSPQLQHSPARINPSARRSTIASLLTHLAATGFRVVGVDDGSTVAQVDTAAAATDAVLGLDEARIFFQKAGYQSHSVTIDGGCISDWTCTEGDPDRFNASMGAFDAERFA